jgi:hypothetical protein
VRARRLELAIRRARRRATGSGPVALAGSPLTVAMPRPHVLLLLPVALLPPPVRGYRVDSPNAAHCQAGGCYPVDGVTPPPVSLAPLMPLCRLHAARCVEEPTRCSGGSCVLNGTRPAPAAPANQWAFDPRGSSQSSCAAHCWQGDLRYAAVQGQRCECGNRVSTSATLLPLSDCAATACPRAPATRRRRVAMPRAPGPHSCTSLTAIPIRRAR